MLRKELEDANLDLEDARKSRRDLQVQLNAATTRVGQVNVDCEGLRVCLLADRGWAAGRKKTFAEEIGTESKSLYYGVNRWRWYDRKLPPKFQSKLSAN